MPGGPSANDVVMMASEAAAMSAPLRPCRARATISIWWSTDAPPAREVKANITRAVTKVRRWPK